MIKELDVVVLRDGRTGTVLEQSEKGPYLIEVADKSGQTIELFYAKSDEIIQVTYSA